MCSFDTTEEDVFTLDVDVIQDILELLVRLKSNHLLGLGGKQKSYYKAMLHFKLSSITRFNKSSDYYNVFLLHK